MKSIPRVILCATGLVSVSILFLITMPVEREDLKLNIATEFGRLRRREIN
ncbi:unnamed protein product [Acanthoscelides obtectus]|uniref:Uncharacterized protein n=1 Tax=Acanthoscelides obtectus TaxID=200917 RepID=A0A9P0M734_ACAOB|nr:unnamed protein product [Acanthoscelides obtectus]CAK1641727.1 hypothetical protein AOBTE_LOCUS12591 [Acanthoscelides obtectus]